MQLKTELKLNKQSAHCLIRNFIYGILRSIALDNLNNDYVILRALDFSIIDRTNWFDQNHDLINNLKVRAWIKKISVNWSVKIQII